MSTPRPTFIVKLADFVLFSDDYNREWVKEPRVMRAWRITFIAVLCAIFIQNFLLPLATDLVTARIVRILKITSSAAVLWAVINLTLSYYFFLLRRGKNLILGNVVVLYLAAIICFAHLYQDIYNLSPERFAYQSAPYIAGVEITHVNPLKGIKAVTDFLIYSASKMVASSYWKLESQSYLVSVINILQSLYGLFFLVLVFTPVAIAAKKK